MEEHYLKSELYELIRSDGEVFDFLRAGSLDGVWFWDLENPEHEWMSPEFWRSFGFDPEAKEHLASERQEVIFPEDRDKALANFEAHCADPAHPYDQIVRYRGADGGTVWVRCRGVAIRDEAGKPIRMLGAHTDLTDLMNEKASAEATGALLQSVLDTATSGIVGLDEEGVIRSINPAARHMLGAINDPTPLPWPSAIRFLDPEDMRILDASSSPLHRAMAGAKVKGEIHLLTRATSDLTRYVRFASAKLDTKASPVTTVLVMDDVSDQEMNRQQVERKSRLDALGQLTGGIAHDFNNLLATVQYASKLLEAEPISDKGKEHNRIIRASIERGVDLTTRLLAFAKRQIGIVKSHPIESVLNDFERLIRPTIEESIHLELVCEDPGLMVFCDHPQLENALLNLVLNSRDAILRSGKGSRITVNARGLASSPAADQTLLREESDSYAPPSADADEANRFIEFSVSDDGPGMTPEVRRRSVDPFFTTKATNSGTGLGLSMVYGFLQQNDGLLRIYSEEGEGATVRLILPRGDSDDQREGPQTLPQAPQGDRERVLVAEDDALLQTVIKDIIESFGYEVMVVGSGRAALARIEAGEEFDVLLTDIVMPGGLGGFELAKKARDAVPDLPIIYMSGYAGHMEKDMGDVVAPMARKPCQPHELAELLSAAIKGRSAA
ncbi:MAG: PAS domain-containing protein [Pseudomonadota bacterium]